VLSSPDTLQVARRYPATLLRLPNNRGPSAARNHGVAHAQGRLLFFVDADVALGAGTLARGRALIEQPGVDAVIGSYDDEPTVRTLVSQFKTSRIITSISDLVRMRRHCSAPAVSSGATFS
jgi:glycosyltransferase involved in cell wall biosynthesis